MQAVFIVEMAAVMAASAIIVTQSKLIFVAAGVIMMHVCQAQLVAKATGPPAGWQTWAQEVLQHLHGLSNMPLSEQEVRGPACCNTMEKCLEGHHGTACLPGQWPTVGFGWRWNVPPVL